MNSRVIAATLSICLTIACASTAASQWAPDLRLAQANSDAGGNLQGIGLTASHKQIIYDKIIGVRSQSLPDNQHLAVLLKDFKYVKLGDDKILIVDPATREIMDIITKQESGR